MKKSCYHTRNKGIFFKFEDLLILLLLMSLIKPCTESKIRYVLIFHRFSIWLNILRRKKVTQAMRKQWQSTLLTKTILQDAQNFSRWSVVVVQRFLYKYQFGWHKMRVTVDKWFLSKRCRCLRFSQKIKNNFFSASNLNFILLSSQK
jgi:hypothetical protein